MRIFPALLDHRPGYHQPGDQGSLLLTPMAAGSLVCEVHARLDPLYREAFAVVPTFEPTPEYVTAIKAACRQVKDVQALPDYIASFSGYDLKDWLLIGDPSCFPLESLNWPAIEAELARHRHGALHVIALDANPGGTTERVHVDADGRVRRIQRYYDAHTWAFAGGIACSFVPVSALIAAGCTAFSDLRALRQELARKGIPSRDVTLPGAAIDLTTERALLWLSERCILASHGHRPATPAPSAAIHRTARLIGPVLVHDDAVVEAGAQVIGPSVVGAGARIGPNAIVAQCLVARGARVAPGAVLRHRAVSGRVQSLPVDDGDGQAGGPPELPSSELRPRTGAYMRVKLVVDAAAAAVGLLLLSPLLAIIAVLIKLESRGPILYGDERETIGGRVFRCWKFRTMCQGADAKQRELQRQNEVDGPQFKIEGDPRVTRLGNYLRKYSLDELPQLINVLLGEMSLVGPRPSPFRENQICVPWRDARLSVRAGITGLWQVCREERTTGDFHQWIYYDLVYVRHLSMLVDLRILLATVWTRGGATRVPLTFVLPGASTAERGGATTAAAGTLYESAIAERG